MARKKFLAIRNYISKKYEIKLIIMVIVSKISDRALLITLFASLVFFGIYGVYLFQGGTFLNILDITDQEEDVPNGDQIITHAQFQKKNESYSLIEDDNNVNVESFNETDSWDINILNTETATVTEPFTFTDNIYGSKSGEENIYDDDDALYSVSSENSGYTMATPDSHGGGNWKDQTVGDEAPSMWHNVDGDVSILEEWQGHSKVVKLYSGSTQLEYRELSGIEYKSGFWFYVPDGSWLGIRGISDYPYEFEDEVFFIFIIGGNIMYYIEGVINDSGLDYNVDEWNSMFIYAKCFSDVTDLYIDKNNDGDYSDPGEMALGLSFRYDATQVAVFQFLTATTVYVDSPELTTVFSDPISDYRYFYSELSIEIETSINPNFVDPSLSCDLTLKMNTSINTTLLTTWNLDYYNSSSSSWISPVDWQSLNETMVTYMLLDLQLSQLIDINNISKIRIIVNKTSHIYLDPDFVFWIDHLVWFFESKYPEISIIGNNIVFDNKLKQPSMTIFSAKNEFNMTSEYQKLKIRYELIGNDTYLPGLTAKIILKQAGVILSEYPITSLIMNVTRLINLDIVIQTGKTCNNIEFQFFRSSSFIFDIKIDYIMFGIRDFTIKSVETIFNQTDAGIYVESNTKHSLFNHTITTIERTIPITELINFLEIFQNFDFNLTLDDVLVTDPEDGCIQILLTIILLDETRIVSSCNETTLINIYLETPEEGEITYIIQFILNSKSIGEYKTSINYYYIKFSLKTSLI